MKKKYFSYDDFSYNICSDRHCVKSSKYFYLASLCKIAHICYLYNVRTTYIYSLISYNVCKISICEYSLFCILNPDFFFHVPTMHQFFFYDTTVNQIVYLNLFKYIWCHIAAVYLKYSFWCLQYLLRFIFSSVHHISIFIPVFQKIDFSVH